MKGFISKDTAKTPAINFNPEAGTLEIKGRSIPEDPVDFYRPLMDGLSKCSASNLPKFEVRMNLEYFNTSSSRLIYNIFKKLEALSIAGSMIVVHWAYDEGDEQMLEVGEDFQAILKIPFKMVEVKK